MKPKKIAILVGGSDLFSGMRGISSGTKIIKHQIEPLFDKVLAVNYNYFLDFGSALKKLIKYIEATQPDCIILYGYSKGGEVVLQLSRHLEHTKNIELLITIDIANGPWSNKINRQVPGNVKKNINVYQTTPKFPLRSHGMPATGSTNNQIENINLSNQRINGVTVNHGNIEILMIGEVTSWIRNAINPPS